MLTVACLMLSVSTMHLNAIKHATRPLPADLPEPARAIFEDAIEAEQIADTETAYEAYVTLAGWAGLDREARTYFIAKKAGAQMGRAEFYESIDTLHYLAEFRSDSEEMQFLAELEAAYVMSQAGGPRPNFRPTIHEMEAQFGRVFARYDPYRWETIEAHMEFAGECILASSKRLELVGYAKTAVEHVEEALAALEAIAANPSLANEETLRQADRLRSILGGQLTQFRQWREGIERSARMRAGQLADGATDDVFDALMEDESSAGGPVGRAGAGAGQSQGRSAGDALAKAHPAGAHGGAAGQGAVAGGLGAQGAGPGQPGAAPRAANPDDAAAGAASRPLMMLIGVGCALAVAGVLVAVQKRRARGA
ncbi:MAG: hypothetical protein JXR94_06680 [Candidatus Hydrogenedentes bacterium]|nr:hypothetical protein [Candidatus Hydrogenedentota bacterium]